MWTEPATAPPPDQSRAALEVFAQAVLTGTPPDEVVSTVIARGRPGRWDGITALRAEVTGRRIPIPDQWWMPLTDQVRAAKAAEYRVLFADPDDLARLEEAELLGLPDRTAALHQALCSRSSWRSPVAEQAHREAVGLVASLVSPQIRAAAAEVDRTSRDEIAAMVGALTLLGELVADRATDLVAELAPLHRATAVTPDRARSVEDLVDQLCRRARAQDQTVRAANVADQRHLQISGVDMAGRSPALRSTFHWDRMRHMGEHQPPWGEYLFSSALVNPVAVNAGLDLLEQGLAQDHPGAQLDDVDPELLEQVLGRPTRRGWEDLLRTVQAATLPGPDGRQLDEAALRRQLPAAALRLGARTRRNPTGPATADGRAVVLVLDAAGDPSRWPAVRAAGLAAGELVRRRGEAQPAALVVLEASGEATPASFGSLLDRAGGGVGSREVSARTPVDPAKVLGVLRRTVAGIRAEAATVVLIGAEDVAAAITRVATRWEWTVQVVPVAPAPSPDEDVVGLTVSSLVTALTASDRLA